MKVLLIHPECRTIEPPQHAPYGILGLAAITDQLGHKIAIFDNNCYRLPIDAVRQTIKEEQWDVIGISGLITQAKAIKPIVKVCREEHPAAVIVGGSGFMSSMPFEMLRWMPDFDLGVIGEGYITWQEIMEHIDDKNWKRIKGLIYREGKKVKLSPMRPFIEDYYYCEEHKQKHYTFDETLKNDYQCPTCKQSLINNLDEEIPFPAYEFSPIETYLMHSQIPYSAEAMHPNCRRLDCMSSYGCPYTCYFCFHPSCSTEVYGKVFAGKPYRQHSPQYIVNLISHLRQQYCVNFISFLDENFAISRKWFFEFCSKLEESGLATLIHWGIVSHTKTVDAELLQKGKDTGLSYISYGGEATSQKLLKQIGKGQTKETMTAAIEATQAAGVNPIMSFIVGHPNTTIDDLIEDCNFFIDNQVHVVPFFLTPYPATPIYRQYKDKIIEQWLTEDEADFLTTKKLSTALSHEYFGDNSVSLSASQINKNVYPTLSQWVKDRALERWVLNLDDATKFSVNLTDFNDIELAGLRYFMSTWDIEKLKKFKKELEARKHE